MKIRSLLVVTLAAGLAAPGCVSETETIPPQREPAPAASGGGGAPVAAPPAAAPAVKPMTREEESEFSRQLFALDRRADEWVYLGSQPGEDARQRRELVESALEATVSQHLEPFLALAADASDPTRRVIAAKALWFTEDRRATAPMVRALAETPGDVVLQTNAGLALARLRDPDTPLGPLLACANSPDREVRSNALLALYHVIDERSDSGKAPDAATRDSVLTVLETALFDPDEARARAHAAAALGSLGDPRAVDPLLNLLRDKDPFVRMHTALALGKLGDRRAVYPLVEVIDDTPRGMPRSGVLLALGMLLEKHGVKPPKDLRDDGRSWSDFVRRELPAEKRAPERP